MSGPCHALCGPRQCPCCHTARTALGPVGSLPCVGRASHGGVLSCACGCCPRPRGCTSMRGSFRVPGRATQVAPACCRGSCVGHGGLFWRGWGVIFCPAPLLEVVQPRRSSLVGGSTAGHTTGLAQGEERPSWWSVVARHGRHRHCCGRRRNRTPALSDLTVFKTVPAPRGVTFQSGDGRI